ncbi:MAG: sulfite exporter TauE/SafE family protein [Chloroflexi bacterium]|nr:sulfite exporter TauE/SafE family protein [Chloroflexota bacterium]
MEHLAFAVVAFVAASAQALLGVGFGIIIAPLGVLLLAPSAGIAATLVLGSLLGLILYVEYRPRSPLPEVAPLALAGLFGVPIGLVLLTQADADLLKLCVGVMVLVSALATLVHGNVGRPRRPRVMRLALLAGLASGMFRGAVGIPGPPVLLHEHWRGGSAHAVRSVMFGFNGLLAIPAIIFATASGALSVDVWEYVLVALPGLAFGVAVGARLRQRTSDAMFTRASLVLLLAAGALGVASATTALT